MAVDVLVPTAYVEGFDGLVSRIGRMRSGQVRRIYEANPAIWSQVEAIAADIEASTDRQDLDAYESMAEYPRGSIPLTRGRAGRPMNVAQLVVFLLSDAAAHITGTEVWIDGAESLLVG